MKQPPLMLFGIPVMGVILPFIGRRRLALNRDGSLVNTGEFDLADEVGFFYIEPWVVEWLNFGITITDAPVRLTSTGEIVDEVEMR